MKKIFLTLIASVSLLMISGCSNLTDAAGKGNDSGASVSGKALITGCFSQDVNGAVPEELLAKDSDSGNSGAKTAYPSSTTDELKTLYYTVEGVEVNTAETVSGTVYSSSLYYMIALGNGTWNINLKGYKNYDSVNNIYSNPVYEGSTANSITITNGAFSGASSELNISVTGITDQTQGLGDVSLSMTVASDSTITKAHAVLSKNGTSYTSTDISFTDTNSYTDAISFSSLTPGVYTGHFIFQDANGATVYAFDDTVNVFANLTTNSWKDSASSSYISDGKINVTLALVKSFSNSVFYVDQTNGSDSNSGGYFDPFKTLPQAMNVIKEINDSSTEYRIYLLSDYTQSGNTDLTKTSTIYNMIYASPATGSTALKLNISSYGNAVYKIDAAASTDKNRRHIYVDSTATVTLSNIELTGGYISIYPPSGGGSCVVYGTLNVSGGTKFTGNNVSMISATNYGGGAIAVLNSGILNVSGGAVFDSNTVTDGCGGAICATSGTLNVYNATFSNNKVTSTSVGYGGAISAIESTVVIRSSTFTKNSSSQYGGAIHKEGIIKEIDGCRFEQNSSTNGGALYCRSITSFYNTTFYKNTATANGGAINFQKCTTTTETTCAIGVTFEENSAANGGALYFIQGNFSAGSTTISGGTTYITKFINNSATGNGGAIYFTTQTGTGILTMEKPYFSGNTATGNGNAIYLSCGGTTTSAPRMQLSNSYSADASDDIYEDYQNSTWPVITVGSSFVPTSTIHLTLASYAEGQSVYTGTAANIATTAAKTKITETGWKVNSSGNLESTAASGSMSYTDSNVTFAIDSTYAFNTMDTAIDLTATLDKGESTETDLTQSASDWTISVYSNGTLVASNVGGTDSTTNAKVSITNTAETASGAGDAVRRVTIKSGITEGTKLDIYASLTYNGRTYGGTGAMTVTTYGNLTASDFTTLLPLLEQNGQTYTLKADSSITDSGLSTIGTALKNNTSVNVILDLSETTLTTIASSTFSGATGLKGVVLSESTATIGVSAFANTSLTTITIPASVTRIMNSAFNGCSSLATAVFEDTTSTWKIGKSGVAAVKTAYEPTNPSTNVTYMTAASATAYIWTKN